ncbi:hypothetical protein [Corynebacterium sp. 5QC2CO]|uniref:hypothetical protein n=1 Tax=Corynebacterium sp. 5QC2CO TaxID=2968468 RepID=UPI00211B94D3|nr:hypothetical protein [Corynebacterium sp. 5QC2CO]MCQ9351192.1 hypothetical protein [Corynebacterium sp. 5QC2CO]
MRFTKSLATIVFIGSLLADAPAYAIGGDSQPMIDAATGKAMVKAANAGEPLDVVAVLRGQFD